MKTIVDISRHQRDIKIADLKGVDGVIYRLSIGTSKLDECFDNFMKQKNDPLGVYVASYGKKRPGRQKPRRNMQSPLAKNMAYTR